MSFLILGDEPRKRKSSLLNGLTAYWPLSEAAGNSRVDIINGYSMDETGGAVGTAAGKNYANAVVIDGAGASYLACAACPNINFGTGGAVGNVWTIAMWVMHYTWPGAPAPLYMHYFGNGQNQWSGGYTCFESGVSGDAVHYVAAKANGSQVTHAGGATTLNAWHALRFWYDPVTGNDAAQADANAADLVAFAFGCAQNTANGFFIGVKPVDLTKRFDGRIAQIAVWNRALIDAEWAEWYNAGAGKPYPF